MPCGQREQGTRWHRMCEEPPGVWYDSSVKFEGRLLGATAQGGRAEATASEGP